MSPQVTTESIPELLAAGVRCKDIAGMLNCSVATLYVWMREARNSNPEIARRDQGLRTCECGYPKRPSSAMCRHCTSGRTRPQSKPWQSGEAVQQDLRLVEEKPQAAGRPENVPCQCGSGRLMAASALACVVCEGTGEKLDRLMAAERGISVKELRRRLRCQKYGQKRQGVAA